MVSNHFLHPTAGRGKGGAPSSAATSTRTAATMPAANTTCTCPVQPPAALISLNHWFPWGTACCPLPNSCLAALPALGVRGTVLPSLCPVSCDPLSP